MIHILEKHSLDVFKLKVTTLALCMAIALASCSKKANEMAPPDAISPVVQTIAPAMAYITHEDGPVSIYSLADFTKKGIVPVGQGAHGVGLSDDGQFLLVGISESKDLAIVDTTSQKVLRRIPVGNNPQFLRVQGNFAFVSYKPSAEEPAKVAMIDLIKGEKIKDMAAGFDAEGIEFSADGKHLIAINEAEDNVVVQDIETGELVKQIKTDKYGIRPRSVKRSPDDEHFVITLEYSNKILILDKEYDVINEAATGEVPYGVSYTRDGSEILVALARGNAIQIFDTETLELKREIPVGERCLHFSFTPDDTQLIVACGRSNNILVIDYATGNLIKTIPEKNSPWGVVVLPKAIGSQGALQLPDFFDQSHTQKQ